MLDDTQAMRLALDEAKKGLGRTSPNPCVGAVLIVEGILIATGYHAKAGEAHAEVNCLRQAGDKAVGGTLYVTLEPCHHTGRTPPCTAAILAAGVSRVVVAMADPNPIAGGGATYLRCQGISVSMGLLADEAEALNYPFLKHHVTGLPWVIMKAGMSLDGRISYQRGKGGQITGPHSQQRTHQLRDRCDAILVGIETVLSDNPALTTRLSAEIGRDPIRVILDSQLRIPLSARVLTQSSAAKTHIFCAETAAAERVVAVEAAGAIVHPTPRQPGQYGLSLSHVMTVLGQLDICSLLIEGGSEVHGAFLVQQRVDEFYLFVAPIFIGAEGTPLITACSEGEQFSLTHLPFETLTTECLGDDFVVHARLTPLDSLNSCT